MLDLDRMEKAINSKRISPPPGTTREDLRLFIIRSAEDLNEGSAEHFGGDGATTQNRSEE